MYAKIVIVGNLGQDPELRFTPSGQAYCRMSVATNRKWKDKEGNVQEETTWFRVTVWGAQAEACNQYLTKGRRVLIEGDRIKASAYLNKDNQAQASLELTASMVRFLDRAGAGEGHGQAEPAAATAEEVLPF